MLDKQNATSPVQHRWKLHEKFWNEGEGWVQVSWIACWELSNLYQNLQTCYSVKGTAVTSFNILHSYVDVSKYAIGIQGTLAEIQLKIQVLLWPVVVVFLKAISNWLCRPPALFSLASSRLSESSVFKQ